MHVRVWVGGVCVCAVLIFLFFGGGENQTEGHNYRCGENCRQTLGAIQVWACAWQQTWGRGASGGPQLGRRLCLGRRVWRPIEDPITILGALTRAVCVSVCGGAPSLFLSARLPPVGY